MVIAVTLFAVTIVMQSVSARPDEGKLLELAEIEALQDILAISKCGLLDAPLAKINFPLLKFH